MPRPQLVPLIIGLTVLFFCPSCRHKSHLHERIVAADTSKYCRLHDPCFNPHVLAIETGYDVTTFLGSKPQHTHVSDKALAEYLESHPMEVWPRGALIAMSPTDDVTDQRAVARNFYAAQQIFRSLGLQVEVRPGG